MAADPTEGVATERAARPSQLGSAVEARLRAEPAPLHAAVVTPRTAAAPHAHEKRRCGRQHGVKGVAPRKCPASSASRRWSMAALAERGSAHVQDCTVHRLTHGARALLNHGASIERGTSTFGRGVLRYFCVHVTQRPPTVAARRVPRGAAADDIPPSRGDTLPRPLLHPSQLLRRRGAEEGLTDLCASASCP